MRTFGGENQDHEKPWPLSPVEDFRQHADIKEFLTLGDVKK